MNEIEWQYFFRCADTSCTRGFVTKRGSRRKYCDECLARRRRLGKGRPRKAVDADGASAAWYEQAEISRKARGNPEGKAEVREVK